MNNTRREELTFLNAILTVMLVAAVTLIIFITDVIIVNAVVGGSVSERSATSEVAWCTDDFRVPAIITDCTHTIIITIFYR